ncbi:hypothetical protein JZU71_02025, partial [bacterium]|nr:hypothetical protein [bacterium]
MVPEDIEEGLRQMSIYLVSDFGYEMRDVAGTPEDIFYAFIGKSELLTQQDLDDILQTVTADLPTKEIADLLLWYGFLGINDESGKVVFI